MLCETRGVVQRRMLWVGLAAPLVGCGAGTAAADGRDRAATSGYLHAEYLFQQAAAKILPTAGVLSAEGLASTVGAECPGVVAGAPAGQQKSTLDLELVVAELRAVFAPLRPAVDRLAAETKRLRWDDRVLNRLVHANIAYGVSVLVAPSPSVCADMRAWVASGYRHVPAEARRLEQSLSLADTETPVRERMARYESPAERRLVRRTEAMTQATSGAYLPRYNATVAKVNAALGIPANHGIEPGHLKTPTPG